MLHPGTRMQRIRASHSFGFVLLLILTSFVFVASAPDESWSQSLAVLIEASTLIVALWTSGLWRDRRPALVAATAGIAAAIGQSLSGDTTATGATGLVDVLLLVATAIVIGFGVLDQGEVNRQSVLGAISIYVLLGMIFTFAYGAVAALGSSPFFAQGTSGTSSLRLYFSYVTLSTLGYGDYTPAGTLGHTLAVAEALIGQLYLVTVIALLVGNLGQNRRE